MDAVKYIKEKNRMCKNYYECIGCPIYDSYTSYDPREDVFCECWIPKHSAEAVALVENWSKEHPQKTLKDDFLEKYPDTVMREILDIPLCCARWVYGEKRIRCSNNCEECWNRPLSEVLND